MTGIVVGVWLLVALLVWMRTHRYAKRVWWARIVWVVAALAWPVFALDGLSDAVAGRYR